MIKPIVYILLVSLVVILSGCVTSQEAAAKYSLSAVAAKYIQEYGPAEEQNEYRTSEYHSVTMWWYSTGHQVVFVELHPGMGYWRAASFYNFDPMK